MDVEMTPSQELWYSLGRLVERLAVPGLCVLFIAIAIVVALQLRKRRTNGK